MSPAVSVLIPWRPTPEREPLFEYVCQRWETYPVEIVTGWDEGDAPFSRSRALNRAAAQASGDVFALWDADCIPTEDAVERFTSLPPFGWGMAYTRLEALRADSTQIVLRGLRDGYDPDLPWYSESGFVFGILGVRRDLWETAGGMDEAFQGWGFEDMALHKTLGAYAEPTAPRPGLLRSLFHIPASHLYTASNRARYFRDYEDPDVFPSTLARLRDAANARKGL